MAEPEEATHSGFADEPVEVSEGVTQQVSAADVTERRAEEDMDSCVGALNCDPGLSQDVSDEKDQEDNEACEDHTEPLGDEEQDAGSGCGADIGESAPLWELNGSGGETTVVEPSMEDEGLDGAAEEDCRMEVMPGSVAGSPPVESPSRRQDSEKQGLNGANSPHPAVGAEDVNQPLLVEEEMDLVMQSVEGPEQAEQEAPSRTPSSLLPTLVPRIDTTDCSLGGPAVSNEGTSITSTAVKGAQVSRGSLTVTTWAYSRTNTINGNAEKLHEVHTPPLQIKDEPVDEEYDRALGVHPPVGGIKDEPEVSEELGLQQNSEELRISAVFSVSGNSNPTAPVSTQPVQMVAAAPPKTLMVTMSAAPPLTPLAPAAPSPMGGVRVSCSGCRKVLLKGQTAYQRKGSSQLFCSTMCLTGYTVPAVQSVAKKTCHSCQKEIKNPKDVIMAPVDSTGSMKDFCSHNCLTEFDVLKKAAASTVTDGSTIKCGMCQKTAVVRRGGASRNMLQFEIRHEVKYQGVVHKLCSDACFSRFRTTHRLTMNCCENCGSYCYSANGQSHMLQIEGATKKFCSPSCITAFKQKSAKVTPCAMCFTLRSSAEMVESVSSQGRTELFCSAGCVTAHKVNNICSSKRAVQCNQCRVTAVPQYHLAMSDSSMRHFCSYNCVVNFQTVFNKAAPQSQLSVVPPVTAVSGPAPPAPQPVTPTVVAPEAGVAGATGTAGANTRVGPISAVRGPVKLTCRHCCRLFASKPELFEFKGEVVLFCGKTCSEEFKKVNFIMARCEYCKIDKVVKEVKRINQHDCSFCSEGCKLLYKHDMAKRWGKHCHACAYCGNMTHRVVHNHFAGKLEEFCGDICMSQYTVLFYQMSKCDACRRQGKLIESLRWMGEMKHFCNLQCLLHFCSQRTPAVPPATGGVVVSAPLPVAAPAAPPPPSTTASTATRLSPVPPTEATPIIANVVSLASVPAGQPNPYANTALQGAVPTTQAKVTEHASTQTDALRPPPVAPVRLLKNKALLCKPMSQNKGTSCKPHTQTAETQTDEVEPKVIILPVPVPVPMFVPIPLHLYSQYTPFPLGLPVPLPVPMILPTTLDSAERIMETIQGIKDKIPSDPYEADIILMADMVAQEEGQEVGKKPVSHGDQVNTYSGELESEAVSPLHSWEDESVPPPLAPAPPAPAPPAEPSFSPMLDLEADFPTQSFDPLLAKGRGSIATRHRGRRRPREGFPPRKRGRKRAAAVVGADVSRKAMPPDSGSKLLHMYGVNAWRAWVQWRNQQPDLEKPKFGTRTTVLKEDVLQCSTTELSFGLCRFISEVRRPGGQPYSPDSIFYLCLGLQQYLFENGRMENIFTDVFYSKFILEITKMLRDWRPTILPSGYVHSRVEEEYLWECKQLGAYSPIVLLNTLLFFSTKLFRLKNLAQHGRLSFASVVRCTRTLKNNSKRNFLRFYPPVPRKDGDSTDKAVQGKRKMEDEEEEDVMEMPENTENPLRCPVRLYEFYLSKCSDSVKQRTDVFYLQPERSCVPNSPLWYSSQPLEGTTMETMLTRILTVREVHLQREQGEAPAPLSDNAASE
ncbi:zinc finger MYM-type protein 4 isoform X2 [Paramormyrops kingsleyae]|uniref:zinc finger MYM-type protein 4 isoform X2 n=1 Tax=Paramormyrops kingsleyae TaxID=1676925 RepID=UPI003B96EC7D